MAGGAQNDGDESINGINVTPLVDITLVLLIIFMVTARLIVSKSVPLDLPHAATGTSVQDVFSVVLAADGTVQVDSKTVLGDDAVFPLARAAREKNAELRAVIKADNAITYGRMVHVLDLLKQAQIGKIAFAVQPGAPAPQVPPQAPPGSVAPAPPK